MSRNRNFGHIAAYKIGAIAVPLFTLFGTDALTYRLTESEAKVVITDATNLPKILDIRTELPHLKTVLATGGKRPDRRFLGLYREGAPTISRL